MPGRHVSISPGAHGQPIDSDPADDSPAASDPAHARMQRITFLRLLAATAAGGLLRARAAAGRHYRIMIPANPGGGWDTTARLLGEALRAAKLADLVAYENKGGAAGALGLAQFVNASRGDPDALMVMGAVMVGGILTGKYPVSLAQATPIACLTTEYNVFVLPAGSPLRSMADVIARLKKDPGSVKWGGGSRGSTEHIAAAIIAHHAGVDPGRLNYVAFRGGGEATAAVLAGDVTVGGSSYSEFAEFIRAGRMKPIAVTSPQRLPGVNAPTLRELGVPLVLGNWRGVYGAPGITPAQRQALTQAVLAAVRTRVWTDAVARNEWTPAVLTGAAFDRFVATEFAQLRTIMQQAGLV